MWNGILTSTRGRDGRRSTCRVDASMLDCKKNRSIWRRAQQEEHYGAKDNFFFSV